MQFMQVMHNGLSGIGAPPARAVTQCIDAREDRTIDKRFRKTAAIYFPGTTEIVFPNIAASCLILAATSAYCLGNSACGPSDLARSGQSCTSIWTPSAPTATPARAQGGIRSGRPVA